MKKIFSFAFFLFCVGVFSVRAQDTITVNFAYTGAVQNWTVPCGVKQVTIKVTGAAGGNMKQIPVGTYFNTEGRGASFTGLCTVVAGDNLSIVAGGTGTLGIMGGSYPGGAGGGGGTFVYDSNTLNLIAVAAGGGGAGIISHLAGSGGIDLINDSTTQGQDTHADTTGGIGGNGGNGGNGGPSGEGGSGGSGWYSSGGNGQTTPDSSFGGKDRANLFHGGKGYKLYNGGYGGGGGGGEMGGGGGGGYNGGGGAVPPGSSVGGGGGGGSYLNGTLIGTPIATNTGAGSVSITYIVNPLKENSISVNQNVSCNGGNNGSASVTVTGGVLPYTYLWSDAGSQTNATAIGLSAGSYTVTVTDSCGAFVIDSVKITQPNALKASASVSANVSCNGGNNGSASISVTGGVLPYTYLWSDGGSQTNATATRLSAGSYTVTVTDSCGAFVIDSVKTTQPNALKASASVSANVSCNGGNNGSAFVVATGGTSQYTYLWSDAGSQTNATATGLSAGSYTVTVTDSCGASVKDSVIITQPPSIILTADSTNVTAGCNGSAWVTVSGGTGPYTYLWNTGATNYMITNQCGGNYCCLVTDASGCEDSTCTTINLTTGMENINSGNALVSISPNPSNGVFTVAISNYELGINNKIEVYNMLGEKLPLTLTLSPKGAREYGVLDMSKYPTGIYLYRITSVQGQLVGSGKIIKE